MKKISKKIISSILIMMLLMPTFLVFAEELNIEHEYKLEEYLKENHYVEELTDEYLAQIEKLDIYDEKWNYLEYEDYNMVDLNLEILPKLSNLKSIYIAYSGLKSFDMDLVSNLTQLESLILETDSLKEIKNLDSEKILNLVNLKKIIIKTNNNEFKSIDLSKIINLERLETLEISSEWISNINIKGIPNQNLNDLNLKITCEKLKEVNIDSVQNLKTISINQDCYTSEYELNNIKFNNLNNLTELNIKTEKLSINEILDSINGNTMPKLKSLNFELAEIEEERENLDVFEVLSINSFENLEKLELNIQESKISQLNVKENIEKLEKLYIVYSEINEIKNLDKIQSLNTLFVNGNISKLDLPKTVLDFEACYCPELVEVKLNENLERIAFYNCDLIQELEITENFKKLENLEVNDRNFKKLILPEDTAKLENLKILTLFGTLLNDINYPDNLEMLNISGHNIENLIIPENLKKLSELQINSYNNILQLNLPEDTSKLENLKVLNISANQLNNINYPDNLENLSIECENTEIMIPEYLNKLFYLNINSDNNLQITLPSDTSKLENLETLYIDAEEINSISFPDSLINLNLNINNTEVTISENLKELEYIHIYDYNMERLNFPEDKNKLENLKDITIISKDINNDIKFPNNTGSIYISSEEAKEITISEDLSKLEFLSISAYNLEKLNLPKDTKKLENIIGIHIYDCKKINELNYPDELFSFSINSRENETISINENAKRLYSLEISGDKLREINLPSTLSNLNNLTLKCEEINDLNYPNSLYQLNLTVTKGININLPENTANLKRLEIHANEASINLENLKRCDMNKVLLICKNIQGNCIDELTNLKGLKIFTQESFDTKKISNLKKLQYLSLNQNYKPEKEGDVIVIGELEYNQNPIFINHASLEKKYLYGFNFKEDDKNDTKSDFIKKMDYSRLVEEYNIIDPKLEVLDKDGNAIDDSTIIGTGNIVRIYDGEEVVCEYSIVYYGDVDGDGKWTAIDSLAIIKNNFTKNGYTLEQPFTFADEIFEEAGRIITESGKVPGAMDALAIIKQSFGTYTINQYKNKTTTEE